MSETSLHLIKLAAVLLLLVIGVGLAAYAVEYDDGVLFVVGIMLGVIGGSGTLVLLGVPVDRPAGRFSAPKSELT